MQKLNVRPAILASITLVARFWLLLHETELVKCCAVYPLAVAATFSHCGFVASSCCHYCCFLLQCCSHLHSPTHKPSAHNDESLKLLVCCAFSSLGYHSNAGYEVDVSKAAEDLQTCATHPGLPGAMLNRELSQLEVSLSPCQFSHVLQLLQKLSRSCLTGSTPCLQGLLIYF